MSTGRKIAVVAAVTVTVVGGAIWLWWRFQQAPGPAPDGPRANGQNGSTSTQKWDDSSGQISDAVVYLLTVGPKEVSRRPAQEVWKTLLTGMASDADTRVLLRRLYNDLPVDFVVLPDKAAKDEEPLKRAAAPPGNGFSVVVRVAAKQPLQEVSDGTWCASLGCRQDMRVRPGEKSALFVEMDSDVVSFRPPNDFAVILFAMNDYLFQTRAGYCVFDGSTHTSQRIRSEFPTQDLEAMRANLDRQKVDYLKGYRASQK